MYIDYFDDITYVKCKWHIMLMRVIDDLEVHCLKATLEVVSLIH